MKSFKSWEEQVNQYMIKNYGVGIDDIPDMPWYEWFISKYKVSDAAKKAINLVNSGEYI